MSIFVSCYTDNTTGTFGVFGIKFSSKLVFNFLLNFSEVFLGSKDACMKKVY